MPRVVLTLDRDDFQRLADRAQSEDRDIRHEARRLLRHALRTAPAPAIALPTVKEGRDA